MDKGRFEAILSAYGADPRRWPDAERAEAESFAAAHASEIASLLRDARALDLTLDADAPVAASDLLIARVLAKAPKPRAVLRAVAALAACALFGVAIGFSGGGFVAPAQQDVSETMIAAAFQGSSGDLDWFGLDG